MTTADLLLYYVDRLIIQYKTKPRARATISAFVAEIIADQVYQAVLNGFDLETAGGVQLEAIGTYRGASRFNAGLTISRPYFEFADADENDAAAIARNGFADVSDSDSSITWYFNGVISDTGATYALTDDELRRLIKFKVATHCSDLSIASIDNILVSFFGTKVRVEETGVMQMTYNYQISDTDTLFYVVRTTNSFPRPAGVSVAYVGF